MNQRARAAAFLAVLALAGACGPALPPAVNASTGDADIDTDGEGGDLGGGTPSVEPCPDPACVCLSPQVEVGEPPWIEDAHWDLDGDGWLDRIRPAYHVAFEVWFGTGPGIFASESEHGPLLPDVAAGWHVRVSDIDQDGANDFLFLDDAELFFIPSSELWVEELVEHRLPLVASPDDDAPFEVGLLAGDGFQSTFVVSEDENLVEVSTYEPASERFEARFLLGTDLRPTQLALFDVDADDDLDVVTTDSQADAISVFAWDDGAFAPPQRLPVAELVEVVPLPSRGYLLVHGGIDLFRLRADAGAFLLAPVGEVPATDDDPYDLGHLRPIAGGDSLWWRHHGGHRSIHAVCTDADGLWSRAPLPVWLAGHGGDPSGVTFADLDFDGRDDLSVTEYVDEGGLRFYWRLDGL